MTPADLDKHNSDIMVMLYPDFRSRLARVLQDMWRLNRVYLRLTRGLSSYSDQDKLYAQGRTTPGDIVTWAKGGDSWHNFGIAADVCFDGTDPYLARSVQGEFLWSELGRLAVAHGLQWGGNWGDEKRDRPHLQMTYGVSKKTLQDVFAQQGLSGVWKVLDKKLAEYSYSA